MLRVLQKQLQLLIEPFLDGPREVLIVLLEPLGEDKFLSHSSFLQPLDGGLWGPKLADPTVPDVLFCSSVLLPPIKNVPALRAEGREDFVDERRAGILTPKRIYPVQDLVIQRDVNVRFPVHVKPPVILLLK